MSKFGAKLTNPGESREEFAMRLKDCTNQRGAVARLAKSLPASPTAVRRWINADAEPSRDLLIALARELDVNLEWLCTGRGPKKRLEEQDFAKVRWDSDQIAHGNFHAATQSGLEQGLEPTVMYRGVLSSVIAAYLSTKGHENALEMAEGLLTLHDDAARFLRNSAAHGLDEGVLENFLNRYEVSAE